MSAQTYPQSPFTCAQRQSLTKSSLKTRTSRSTLVINPLHQISTTQAQPSIIDMPSAPFRKEPQKPLHPPTATDTSEHNEACTVVIKPKKASSRMEEFLRRAKEAGVKIEEDDWEVVCGSEEKDDLAEEWVLVN